MRREKRFLTYLALIDVELKITLAIDDLYTPTQQALG